MVKSIAFGGTRSCDLVIYIARVIKALGLSIIVCDLSEDSEFIKYTGIVLEPKTVDELDGVAFYSGVGFKGMGEKYDIVIRYLGNDITNKAISASNMLILSTTADNKTLSEFKLDTDINTISDSTYLINRNTINKNYNAGYSASCLRLQLEGSNLLNIEFSSEDEKSKMENENTTTVKFMRVSSDLKSVVLTIVNKIVGDNKELMKAYKIASKGGIK